MSSILPFKHQRRRRKGGKTESTLTKRDKRANVQNQFHSFDANIFQFKVNVVIHSGSANLMRCHSPNACQHTCCNHLDTRLLLSEGEEDDGCEEDGGLQENRVSSRTERRFNQLADQAGVFAGARNCFGRIAVKDSLNAAGFLLV